MTYKFNSIVNKNEADALKEMIFKRVRERAQSMNEDMHSDIMDIARDSFVSSNNPFSRIVESSPVQQEAKEPEAKAQDNSIGFPVKEPALKQAKINEQISTAVINNNMLEARNTLSSKQSFMGALNFLNSQAAVSLIKTRADRFEMIV